MTKTKYQKKMTDKARNETKKNKFAITFRDVKDSMNPYCGDYKYPMVE